MVDQNTTLDSVTTAKQQTADQMSCL